MSQELNKLLKSFINFPMKFSTLKNSYNYLKSCSDTFWKLWHLYISEHSKRFPNNVDGFGYLFFLKMVKETSFCFIFFFVISKDHHQPEANLASISFN